MSEGTVSSVAVSWARWLVIATAVLSIAMLGWVAVWPYPDLAAGYATTFGVFLLVGSVTAFIVMRSELQRPRQRPWLFNLIIAAGIFVLLLVAPAFIGFVGSSYQ